MIGVLELAKKADFLPYGDVNLGIFDCDITGIEEFAYLIIEAHNKENEGWKQAVIDQLVVLHIYNDTHNDDPRKAIKDLVTYENSLALDPLVSERASELIEQGKKERDKELLDGNDKPIGHVKIMPHGGIEIDYDYYLHTGDDKSDSVLVYTEDQLAAAVLREREKHSTWYELTDNEVQAVWDSLKDALCLDHKVFAKEISAVLREKNTSKGENT